MTSRLPPALSSLLSGLSGGFSGLTQTSMSPPPRQVLLKTDHLRLRMSFSTSISATTRRRPASMMQRGCLLLVRVHGVSASQLRATDLVPYYTYKGDVAVRGTVSLIIHTSGTWLAFRYAADRSPPDATHHALSQRSRDRPAAGGRSRASISPAARPSARNPACATHAGFRSMPARPAWPTQLGPSMRPSPPTHGPTRPIAPAAGSPLG